MLALATICVTIDAEILNLLISFYDKGEKYYRISTKTLQSTLEVDELSSQKKALMDQQMAMIWTREYVSSIGGDPNRLTIGGMSAGGQSINAHMVMPSRLSSYLSLHSYKKF